MDLPEPAWFCIRSQPRRQNVAAARLRSLGVEVFNPQLRIRRAGPNGAAWRTEPLFLNYLFARFEFASGFRLVRYAAGVSDIVNFGGRWASVSDREVAALQGQWGDSELIEAPSQIVPGATVQLTGALFRGMEATVLCLLPARQRVRVLLHFLGGVNEAEIDAALVISTVVHPLAA